MWSSLCTAEGLTAGQHLARGTSKEGLLGPNSYREPGVLIILVFGHLYNLTGTVNIFPNGMDPLQLTLRVQVPEFKVFYPPPHLRFLT